jgi:hypothetical protein
MVKPVENSAPVQVRKYIDINSSYRDRISYPSVADFVIPTNGLSSRNTPDTANDPVILAFPYEASLTSGGSTTTQIALSVLASSISNFYQNSYLEIAGEFRLCTAYDSSTQFATVTPAFSVAPVAITPYTIRFNLPVDLNGAKVYQSVTSNNAVTTSEIYLPAIASNKDNAYVNNYVFLPGATPPDTFQYKRIISYNGTTKRVVIQGVFNSPVTAGTVVEVLRYSYDNVQHLRFYGTDTTNNPVCTSIVLTNLIVPNLPIIGSYGGNLQNYPFMYVAVYSDKGCTFSYQMASNSPVASKALFKVPITFLQGLSFLTLGYSGMTQFVNFKANDSLRITIFLPNGDLFIPQSNNPFTYFETYKQFPIPSDPLVQLQAIFEVNYS